MTPQRSIAQIRADFELGRYIDRADIQALVNAQSTVGEWAIAILDIDHTGVTLWSQGPVSPRFVVEHVTELTMLAHMIVDHGHAGLIAVVHGALMVQFTAR